MASTATTNGLLNGYNSPHTAHGSHHIKATSGGYAKKTAEEKAKLTYQQAISTIKEKLEKMTPLKALLEIDMGGDGPLYLDARGKPKLVKIAEGKPDCQLRIRPEYIIQFAEGKLEPRYGLFKGKVLFAWNWDDD